MANADEWKVSDGELTVSRSLGLPCSSHLSLDAHLASLCFSGLLEIAVVLPW
jgi:hypothetical protein